MVYQGEGTKTDTIDVSKFFFQCQGFITNDVLKDILREIDSTLTEEDLDHIVEEVDEDGSGTMDFDEFQEMMMG